MIDLDALADDVERVRAELNRLSAEMAQVEAVVLALVTTATQETRAAVAAALQETSA